MHCLATSSKAAHRRHARAGAGAGMQVLAVVAMTIAQGVVALSPPSQAAGPS